MKQDIQRAAHEVIERAIVRHGGMQAYEQIEAIDCNVTTMSGFAMKQRGLHADFPLPSRITLMPRKSRAVLHDYPAPGRQCIYDRGYVVEVATGELPVLPKDSHREVMLSVSRFRRPWTTLDAAYFFGYAMTHYASLPFSLRGEKVTGFAARTGGSWAARIDIEYAPGSHTHSEQEAFYFDRSGLLVRHDYCPEVSSPIARAANFLLAYKDCGGYLITEHRKVFFRLGRFVTPLVVMDASIIISAVRQVATPQASAAARVQPVAASA